MTETQNLTGLNRDALRKIAAELKIPGRGNMLKPELIAAIEAIQNDKKITDMAEKMAARVIEMRENASAPEPKRIPGTPLTTTQREDNYRHQNGSPRLTARQARRLGKKGDRALARGAR